MLAKLVGYGSWSRISEIENSRKNPDPAHRILLEKYIRVAKQVQAEGGAKCPACGWWTIYTSGRWNEDGDFENLCSECGNKWF